MISLAMDGFTGAIQDRMRAEHKSKSGHMMLSMNLWSTLFSGIGSFSMFSRNNSCISDF